MDSQVVGVWVGNANGAPMNGVSGAAPIWRAVMDKLHAGKRFQPKLPAMVEARQIRYMPDLEPARRELFLAGTGQNVIVANQHTAQLINHKSSDQKQTLARIAYPGEGTIIALDPEIPALQQKIVFKTNQQQANNRYQWHLNGTYLNQTAWQPSLGRHRLELLNDRHQVVDRIHFEIRGAFLKASTKPPSH